MFIRTARSDDYFILWVCSESVEENQELRGIKEFMAREYHTAVYLYTSVVRVDMLEVFAYFRTSHEIEQASAEITLKFL